MTTKLPSALIQLATAEIGVEEVNGSNCGPRVNQYKAATWLPAEQAWPWCAAFMCWLVREALRITGTKETATFKRPRTAGARDFENWSLAQDNSTTTMKPLRGPNAILPGDIVIFARISHIGLAISAPDSNGYFHTIEGNTDRAGSREGGAVWKKRRHRSEIRSRIRFTI